MQPGTSCSPRKLQTAFQVAAKASLAVGSRNWLTFRSSFLTMSLHCDVCIQVIKCTVCLFAILMSTLVYAINFFISTSRAFRLLSPWDWYEGIDLLMISLAVSQSPRIRKGKEKETHLTWSWGACGWSGSCRLRGSVLKLRGSAISWPRRVCRRIMSTMLTHLLT